MKFTKQFNSEQEITELDRILVEEYHLSAKELKELKDSGYGIRPTKLEGMSMLMFPIAVILAGVQPLHLGWAGNAAAALPGAGIAMMSWYIHRYIHMSDSERKIEAPKFTYWLLSTAWGQSILEHHYLHHIKPNVNSNLLHAYLGGDAFMGAQENASFQDYVNMYRLRLLK